MANHLIWLLLCKGCYLFSWLTSQWGEETEKTEHQNTVGNLYVRKEPILGNGSFPFDKVQSFSQNDPPNLE